MRHMYKLVAIFLLNIFIINDALSSGKGQFMPFPGDFNAAPSFSTTSWNDQGYMHGDLYGATGASSGGMPLPPFKPRFEVNPDYIYESDDMRKILEVHIGSPVEETAIIVSDGDLSSSVRAYLHKGSLTKDLLIAYNTSDIQWIGIYARRIKKGKDSILFYIDPEPSEKPINPSVLQFVEECFSKEKLRAVRGLFQYCEEDSGVITVANLLYAFNGSISPLYVTDSRPLRRKHLEFLENLGDFSFSERQSLGWSTFSYSWDVDGREERKKSFVLPFQQCMEKKDREKIERTSKKLTRMIAVHKALEAGASVMRLPGGKNSIAISRGRDIYGNFLGLFSSVDGSSTAPIGFAVQLQYKQVPWHLLQMHWWASASPQPFQEVVFEELSASAGDQSGLDSLSTVFQKIHSQEPLEEDDLQGVRILTPYWETEYIKATLRDVSSRVESVLFDTAQGTYSLAHKIAILRLMQCTGEYFKKLENIDFFLKIAEKLDCGGFRNVLSHLDDPKGILEALDSEDFDWTSLVENLKRLQEHLRPYKEEWDDIDVRIRKVENLETATAVWKKIKSLRQKKVDLQGVEFKEVEGLREKLSAIKGKKQTQKFSFSDEDMVEIIQNLVPFSRDQAREMEDLEKQKLLESKRNSLRGAFFLGLSKKETKRKTPEEVGKLKTKKNKERRERVESLISKLGLNSHDARVAPLLEARDQGERPIEEISAFIDEVMPIERKAPSEGTQQVLRRQKALSKSLGRVSVDVRPERRLQEYTQFVMNALHRQAGIKLPEEFFWQEIPSYPEVLFYKLQNKPLESPAEKRLYRVHIMENALGTIEWFRRVLGVSSISLLEEVQAPTSGLTELGKATLVDSVAEVEVHFNQAPCSITKGKIEEFLRENSAGMAVLEFFVGAVYESITPIFYFPELKSHFLHNVKVRNYYDHPDPTLRTPLVVWETVNLKKGWDGRTITLRPDRGEGYLKVLVQEASKICIPLHRVLIRKLEEMLIKIDLCEKFIIDFDAADEATLKLLGARTSRNVIESLRSKPETALAKQLDISHNTLGLSGAREFLEYAAQLERLEVLDLSHNKIPNLPQEFGKLGSFEEVLFYLTTRPKVRHVDITENPIACMDWMGRFSPYIAKKLKDQGITDQAEIAAIRDKIKWNSSDDE